MSGSFDKAVLDDYSYSGDPALMALRERDRCDLRRMMAYGRGINSFGLRLVAHQNRVARDGAALLRYLGYSEQAAFNFRAAMLFHDIGKINEIYKAAIWTLKNRPTAVQKAQQKRHARLGAEMFAQSCPELQEHPHFRLRHDLTLYHHERLDGKGPEGIDASTLPVHVQVSCIVDAYDGDRIWRPHQQKRRTPQEALRRMACMDGMDKYLGAFNKDLLQSYIRMKERQHGFSITD